MASRKAKKVYGNVPFSLEAADLAAAKSMGLLRDSLVVQQTDPSQDDYGVAYDRCDNVAGEYHGSQKAIQARCKEFAQACGFQLKVESFSSKRDGVGNAKYVCKKLNGQQFFDQDASGDDIVCPFAFNVCGLDGFWKVTRTNFCHNHIKYVGFSSRPVAEGSVPRPVKAMRNRTQSLFDLVRLIESEMLPMYDGRTDGMTGRAIADFLLGKGYKLGASAISRIKCTIDDANSTERRVSYQKLESYLKLMAEKNPGSIWRFEKASDGTFVWACFIPNIGIRAARMAKRLLGVDGAHLKRETNNFGVFLVATAKDYNNHILSFAFSFVPVENYDHWVWFRGVVKEALEEMIRFTVLSDRQKGLLSAVADVFPQAGHRFCLRHIKTNINSKGISLTGKERGLINDMARSDCENDYKFFEKELARTKPAAVTYLEGIDKKHWVKYMYQEAFGLPTYNETTSNLAEQANSWIGNECRSAKPLEAFALYFRKLSELVSDKRQLAASWLGKSPGTGLVPEMASARHKLTIAGDKCKVTPCMEGAYNVLYLGPVAKPGTIHPWRLVDLPAKECTCGNWQDMEFLVYTPSRLRLKTASGSNRCTMLSECPFSTSRTRTPQHFDHGRPTCV